MLIEVIKIEIKLRRNKMTAEKELEFELERIELEKKFGSLFRH
jgi:hypothetical protein